MVEHYFNLLTGDLATFEETCLWGLDSLRERIAMYDLLRSTSKLRFRDDCIFIVRVQNPTTGNELGDTAPLFDGIKRRLRNEYQ